MAYSRQPNGDSTSEAGLAEWTSRIKAMQRQVDADEEAEQRSLEEEIAASRLARLRRNNRSAASLNAPEDVASAPHSEHSFLSKSPSRTTMERPTRSKSPLQLSQDSPSPVAQPRTKLFNVDKSSVSDKQPISLAAFIGGRATGPRLNKHAPQQDVPFEQVTTNRSVHPVFGAGGVAMPGMAALPSKSPKLSRPAAPSPLETPIATPERRRAVSPAQKNPPKRNPSPDKPLVRERTVTLPAASAPQVKLPSLSSSTSISSAKKMFEMDIPKEERSRAVSLAPKIIDRPPVTQSPASSSKSAVDRDFSPRPTSTGRATAQSPPWTQNRTSPASLSPPSQKELTPSISRLQGRGFVQNMVKKSAQLGSSLETTEEASRGKPLGRNVAVLDRWKPAAAESTPTPLPQPTRKRSPIPNTAKNERPPSQGSMASPTSVKLVNPPPVIVPKPVVGPKPVVTPDPLAPKLGSATTMHLYKPFLAPSPPVVDELGFGGPTPGKDAGISSFPVSPMKPLYHPTKDRAKVARKRKQADQGQKAAPAKQGAPEGFHIATLHQADEQPDKASERIKVPEELPTPRRQSPGPRAVSPSLANRMAAFQQSQPEPMKKPEKVTLGHAPNQVRPSQSRGEKESFKAPAPPKAEVIVAERTLDIGKTTTNYRLLDQSAKPLNAPSSVARSRSRSRSPQNMPQVPNANGQTKTKHQRSRSKSTGKEFTQHRAASRATENATILVAPTFEVPNPSRARSKSPKVPAPNGNVRQSGEADFHRAQLQLVHEERKSRSKSIIAEAAPSLPVLQETEITPSESLLEMLLARPSIKSERSAHQTISLEVLAIVGNSANMVTSQRPAVFHDTEILAIVHRKKSDIDELVSTDVWGWEGKRAKLGEREQRKLQELGKRYGASVNMIQQGFEPRELVDVLRGTLVTRQGPRNHWSTENAAMHLVRSLNGVIYIDEKELSVEHLCSAFSYCVTFMDAVYVWYGRGSTKAERRAAMKYAESLNTSTPPAELEEGQDDNELFWVILGTEEYSDADYWRWRPNIRESDPRVWRIDAASKELVTPVEYIGSELSHSDSVYLLDCFWEFYVLVGSNARLRRNEIGIALRLASEMSIRLSSLRPYKPTTHAIFLPSRIPRDLRLNLRDLDEASINTGVLPDHMNVFPLSDILSHFSSS